jgi:hypothetical protein
MSDPVRFHFDEGSVLLPTGYEDRTVNSFVPANPQRDPNLGISRDWLLDGETLSDYVARQLALVKKKLPGYEASPPTAVGLGSGTHGVAGLAVQASYRSGSLIVHQRQAAFALSTKRVLVFTLSSPRPLDTAADALWAAWLAGFQFAPGA